MQNSSTCYKNTFLKQVIIRIDFMDFIKDNNMYDIEIEKRILKIFPRRGKDQIIRFNSIKMIFPQNKEQPMNTNGEIVEGIQKEYFTNDGQNKLILSNKFIIFEIKNYTNFEEHRLWLYSILSAVYEKNKQLTINRTGIRYINILESSKIKILKKFFKPEIASSLYVNNLKNNIHLVRTMHISEYRVDEMIMNFRYGMYNPEYPNTLKKNDFVLDFDFFSENIIESSDDIFKVIDKGHQEIHKLFESSITSSLREVMNR